MTIDSSVIIMSALVGAFVLALALVFAVVFIAVRHSRPYAPAPIIRNAVQPPPRPAIPTKEVPVSLLDNPTGRVFVGGEEALKAVRTMLKEEEDNDGYDDTLAEELHPFGIHVEDIHDDKRYEDTN